MSISLLDRFVESRLTLQAQEHHATSFDHHVALSMSQSLQNKSIQLIEEGRWFVGRAIGVLKPLPLIVDIAKHLFLALGNILGAIFINPFVWAVNVCKKDPIEYPCLLSSGFVHVSLVGYFTLDLPLSSVKNGIDPMLYTKTQLLTQPELPLESEPIAPTEHANDFIIDQLKEQINQLQTQIQANEAHNEAIELENTDLRGQLTELQAQLNQLRSVQQTEPATQGGNPTLVALTETAKIEQGKPDQSKPQPPPLLPRPAPKHSEPSPAASSVTDSTQASSSRPNATQPQERMKNKIETVFQRLEKEKAKKTAVQTFLNEIKSKYSIQDDNGSITSGLISEIDWKDKTVVETLVTMINAKKMVFTESERKSISDIFAKYP